MRGAWEWWNSFGGHVVHSSCRRAGRDCLICFFFFFTPTFVFFVCWDITRHSETAAVHICSSIACYSQRRALNPSGVTVVTQIYVDNCDSCAWKIVLFRWCIPSVFNIPIAHIHRTAACLRCSHCTRSASIMPPQMLWVMRTRPTCVMLDASVLCCWQRKRWHKTPVASHCDTDRATIMNGRHDGPCVLSPFHQGCHGDPQTCLTLAPKRPRSHQAHLKSFRATFVSPCRAPNAVRSACHDPQHKCA